MSIYKDLNDIEFDFTAYEVEPFSKLEKKRVQKMVVKKLKLNKRRTGFSIGAAAVLAIGLLTVNHQTIANMPFVAGILEDWGQAEKVDWTPYKNVIGATSSTNMGELTLNEVIVNYDKIIISATFVKNEDTPFSYRHQFMPSVLIDGVAVQTEGTAAQSIEQNSTMFTIYNQITLKEPISAADFDLQIIYDRMLTPKKEFGEGEQLSEPFIFDITASQLAIQKETKVHDVNKKVTLTNGEQFIIDQIITTPISTKIYYSGALEDKAPNITLYDEDGNSYYWHSSHADDDGTGIIDFSGVSFVDKEMFLQVVTFEQEPLSERIKVLK